MWWKLICKITSYVIEPTLSNMLRLSWNESGAPAGLKGLCHHWFWKWVGAESAPIRFSDQCWLVGPETPSGLEVSVIIDSIDGLPPYWRRSISWVNADLRDRGLIRDKSFMPSLVQWMVCCRIGASPFIESMLTWAIGCLCNHWFNEWLAAVVAPIHFLNQCWLFRQILKWE